MSMEDVARTMREGEERGLNSAEIYVHMTAELSRNRFEERPKGWMPMALFISRWGKAYEWRPLPKDVPRGTQQQCFDNAYKLAMRRKHLTYVEGYATRIIPVHHAWCVDEDGIVIDPTWIEKEEYDDARAYFGVPFATEFVRQRRYEQRKSKGTSVLDDWLNKFPVLRYDFEYDREGVRR